MGEPGGLHGFGEGFDVALVGGRAVLQVRVGCLICGVEQWDLVVYEVIDCLSGFVDEVGLVFVVGFGVEYVFFVGELVGQGDVLEYYLGGDVG